MQCNVGLGDKKLRIVAGVLILIAGGFYHNWWGAIGLVPLFTGLVRWCPAYTALGINTDRQEKID